MVILGDIMFYYEVILRVIPRVIKKTITPLLIPVFCTSRLHQGDILGAIPTAISNNYTGKAGYTCKLYRLLYTSRLYHGTINK